MKHGQECLRYIVQYRSSCWMMTLASRSKLGMGGGEEEGRQAESQSITSLVELDLGLGNSSHPF